MNMELYNQVKAAIKEGRSLEDLNKEIESMAAKAQDELKPHAPIMENFSDPNMLRWARDNILTINTEKPGQIGGVFKPNLVWFLCAYLVQEGLQPDVLFENGKEFRDTVEKLIDEALGTLTFANKVKNKQLEGAKDEEIMGDIFSYIGEQLFGKMQ